MANTIVMPKLGLTMTEGMVSKWFKKEGDAVRQGEALFEVETDKLVNEVISDYAGILLNILVPEGEMAPCIAPVAYIGEAGEKVAKAEDVFASAPLPEQPVIPQAIPLKHVDGYIPASPAAKRLAHERNICLDDITPTGPEGAILLRDVEQHQGKAIKASGLAAKIAKELGVDMEALLAGERIMSKDVLRAALPSAPSVDTGVREPLNGMRKTIARRMLQSWHASPRVCYHAMVDCSNMIAMRDGLKAECTTAGVNLSYNHLIMLAAARALMVFPDVNASLDDDILIRHSEVNIGLAVAVESGLLVPNLKGCERMGLLAIARGTEAMVAAARDGNISMDALSGGTFTITNLGMYGVRGFSPIINQPELAILGVAAMVDTPVAIGNQVMIRPMMELNLVADHRAIDGVMAAQFLKMIVSLLETPTKMLL